MEDNSENRLCVKAHRQLQLNVKRSSELASKIVKCYTTINLDKLIGNSNDRNSYDRKSKHIDCSST